MATRPSGIVRTIFVTGLQNAHAVENQALALIDRQLDRLIHYPEISDRLRDHRQETEQQIRRLDEMLRELGERPSTIKDIAMGMIGNMAALSHAVADDEVLKNQFVNLAFENFEIASYRSLIAIAEAGAWESRLLETTLREEQAMAAWVEETLPELTLKYVDLRASGRAASR